MNVDKTKFYYNKNYKQYFFKTKDIILFDHIDNFLKNINYDETILELGCGSGNNLKEIIKRGYKAIGADYSKKLIELAKRHSKANIYHLDFSNIDGLNKFMKSKKTTHVFAVASLLHLTKHQFKEFINSIDFPGIMFFSLKEGEGEDIDDYGRYFSYYHKNEVENLLMKTYKILNYFVNSDLLNREERWLSWIIKQKK